MTSTTNGVPEDADRAAHIAGILGRYPNVSTDELGTLKRWFSKEASSLDVALLSSRNDIRPQYAQFRKDHVDPFRPKEVVAALLIFLAMLACAAIAAHL